MLKASPRYTFVDYATQGYIALVGLIVLFLHGTAVPLWKEYVAVHAATMGAVHGLLWLYARSPRNAVLNFLRQFYPMFLYGGFYWETAQLNHIFFPEFLDATFLRFEAHVFGAQPSVLFMDRLPYLAVSEILYASYFSYFLMIAGMALTLFRRSRQQFAHFVAVTSTVFYVCYLCYILLPIVGPLVLYRDLPGYRLPADLRLTGPSSFPSAITGGPFFRLMNLVYVPFESPGASFPSSHVAVAIVTVYFSFLYVRPIRWPHLVLAVLLCASTVYGRYHYVSDVFGGALAAALLIPLGNYLYRRFDQPSRVWGHPTAATPVEAESNQQPVTGR